MTPMFPPPRPVLIPIQGSPLAFPVRRVYCVGRNYAEHAREMGVEVDRAEPTFFMKPPDALVVGGGEIPYPPMTKELHHEVELVVALGSGGRDIALGRAMGHVVGYGVGLDLTRRDLQASARKKGMPWETAKAFDASAPVSSLRLANAGPAPIDEVIELAVDGRTVQRARTSEMVLGVAELVCSLSRYFELTAGDLVFTGTPAGVGPLVRGQAFLAKISGVGELAGRVV